MRSLTYILAIALLGLGSAAEASAQIGHCDQPNPVVGTLVGAAVGGTAGAVIANTTTRNFRGGGFHGRQSFRGRRGFQRRGNQPLGALLGALAGGVVGNQIATARSNNCTQVHIGQQGFGYQAPSIHNGQVLAGGTIDYNALRLGDPYGGRQVISQPVQVAPPLATPPVATPGVFQPNCQNVNRSTRLPDGRQVHEPVEYCQFSPGGEWVER